MPSQIYNPYMPSWEYIPDGEPHVFGDRVYVYGSHDRFNAPIFCMNDYVCWSAPVNDLTDWRYEGVIFLKKQDPVNKLGLHLLFAPDIAQGTDGKFYLYYAFDFLGLIGVAKGDSPVGPFEYYGLVHYQDGTPFGRRKGDEFPFDPGVLVDDDGKVYLYSGFYTKVPAILSGFHNLKNTGGVGMELASDMLTIVQEPRVIFPRQGEGSFPDHEFFEASSIRKDGDRYIFVYSSRHNHELCWAWSLSPLDGYTYGGTLVDQGDLYLGSDAVDASSVASKSLTCGSVAFSDRERAAGNEAYAKNYLGNTHGGMAKINGQWYIFYHRQTNRHSYSRQACAEKLVRTEDGRFLQAEVTSCGLNNGNLVGSGKYASSICCHLWSKDGVGRYDTSSPRRRFAEHPYLTQTGKDRESDPDQYVANMRDGAVCGFKYFDPADAQTIEVELTGVGEGVLEVFTSELAPGVTEAASEVSEMEPAARIEVTLGGTHKSPAGRKKIFGSVFKTPSEAFPLYFRYTGTGAVNFHSFTLK